MKKLIRNIRKDIKSGSNRIIKKFLPYSSILLYHRIEKVFNDPHLLSVDPEIFRDHIKYLSENYNIIPLSQLIDNLVKNKLDKKNISITFDDGYADNFYNALPILKEYNAPATIFVTSGMIDRIEPFYWESEINPRDQGRPLNTRELLGLFNENIIEIGAHTMTHPNLGKIDMEKQREEICGSKNTLENLLGKNINGFAYPFGSKMSFSKETIEIVRSAGFKYACSTFPNHISSFSDIFSLPRLNIRNWNVDRLSKELKNL